MVAPHVGAWIEIALAQPLVDAGGSHPTWVRGLKYRRKHGLLNLVRSHPTWVRGLKYGGYHSLAYPVSRTPRGCVD